ncbi:phosphate starvation-inducible membrane PsiE [Bacillus pakistanensis]|uniref:Phosphate starvation-inducible membrane PsiE n=1 Tax=Rossellomorea pakistanensis TaxID=992288 RepID=A0ABS2N6V7_9BACI|nr:hypothetical protein [Bacillus pakistanensis]MBM7583504.1 phosphate starvation-inducible membrane PsiE [Bacillus pakistanensis]
MKNNPKVKERYFLFLLVFSFIGLIVKLYGYSQSNHQPSFFSIDIVILLILILVSSIGLMKVKKQRKN